MLHSPINYFKFYILKVGIKSCTLNYIKSLITLSCITIQLKFVQ